MADDVTASTGARGRELWPDVAKGLCIVLVVLWHVVTKHYRDVGWEAGLVPAAWSFSTAQLAPMRMPLFFAVSGLFAASAVSAPWRDLLRRRVWRFAGLYALWLLIHTALFSLTPGVDTARARSLTELVEHLLLSPTNLWYLYALALYFLLAKVTARVPTVWLLPLAFLVSAAASADLLPDGGNRWQVTQNLVFFLGALRLRVPVRRFADRATVPRTALALVLYAGASAAMGLLGARQVYGVWPAVSVTAVLFGVLLAVVVARRMPRGARGLAWLGTRTLPVYVLHLPLLALLDRGAGALGGGIPTNGPLGTVLAVVEPLLLTALLVWLCLLVHGRLLAVGLGGLFGPTEHGPRGRRAGSVSSPRGPRASSP
ncbi:acyltransferase family protein [Actinotalea sp. BY-33]|uniref:Acyltransferase family protein n=1 Tax=Actinotalea soli TaxID=2819234 RepID=A0A939RW69_9CELL|nr:acyltransferase family protein [Actinotalea soli]MBO1753130.1 acyltransferase family protein [Actinotalea soli]